MLTKSRIPIILNSVISRNGRITKMIKALPEGTRAKERCQMDIAGLSTAMSMSKVQTDWGMKMLSKAMDTADLQGSQLAQMLASVPTAAQMELSVNPDIGSQFDVRI